MHWLVGVILLCPAAPVRFHQEKEIKSAHSVLIPMTFQDLLESVASWKGSKFLKRKKVISVGWSKRKLENIARVSRAILSYIILVEDS